jgi:hypothetical protein
MSKTIYTFNDGYFGISDDDNQTMTKRLVARPNLLRDEWYEFASELARALNQHADCSALPTE